MSSAGEVAAGDDAADGLAAGVGANVAGWVVIVSCARPASGASRSDAVKAE